MKQQQDIYDGMAAIGLAMLFVGLWWWLSPAIAMAVVGSVLLALAIFLASRRP